MGLVLEAQSNGTGLFVTTFLLVDRLVIHPKNIIVQLQSSYGRLPHYIWLVLKVFFATLWYLVSFYVSIFVFAMRLKRGVQEICKEKILEEAISLGSRGYA